MWEILIALGVLAALVDNTLTVLDIIGMWWQEHKHDRTDG